MSGFLNALSDGVRAKLDRYQNQGFVDAAMGACALVSMADQEVSASERKGVERILATVAQLCIADPDKAVALFNKHVDALAADEDAAREAILSAVAKIATEHDDKVILVKICMAVSLADGHASDEERLEIEALCDVLHVRMPNF